MAADDSRAEATLYRRPLPEDTIAFSSAEGRSLFAEALAAGGLDGYFPLAEQFHTQSEPAYCGLGSLVVALNALAIDPGRLWKGPWRWFGEELLDCCVPLAEVRRRGLDLDELACLARCNGARVVATRADGANLSAFREALGASSRGDSVLIASYDRSIVGQTGEGHFSPIGGYHSARDLVLVLDVARFKYPPHWMSAERLWRAMQSIDRATGQPRGWMSLTPRTHGTSLGFTLRCKGSWKMVVERLRSALAAVRPDASIGELARAMLPMTELVEVRVPEASQHREALLRAREALHDLPFYAAVEEAVGSERADGTIMLLLASVPLLAPAPGSPAIEQLARAFPNEGPLGDEVSGIRAQLTALL